MSYEAHIKVCRAYDPDALVGPVRGSGEVYEPNGLTFFPGETIPLLVDHDPEQEIGRATSLAVWPWIDQRWIVARAEITDPPEWLCKGTRASFQHTVLRAYEFNGWRVVSGALVDEVTILSPTQRPVEPSTEVVLLERRTSDVQSFTASVNTASVGEVDRGGGLIRRYFPTEITVR